MTKEPELMIQYFYQCSKLNLTYYGVHRLYIPLIRNLRIYHYDSLSGKPIEKVTNAERKEIDNSDYHVWIISDGLSHLGCSKQ